MYLLLLVLHHHFFNDLTMGYDGTTKDQKAYQHLRITGSNEDNITTTSLTIGYTRLFATDSSADVDGVKLCIQRLNKYINVWNNNIEVFQNSNYDALEFKRIDARIKNLRFDRSIVNFVAAEKLNQDRDLQFNVTNDKIYNCIRHDKNSLVCFSIFLK